jgi:hypothetical protein
LDCPINYISLSNVNSAVFGKLKYQFEEEQKYFGIEEETGEIFVNSELDFELKRENASFSENKKKIWKRSDSAQTLFIALKRRKNKRFSSRFFMKLFFMSRIRSEINEENAPISEFRSKS